MLLALYATIVLGDAVPVRLMDPAWQLRLYNAVVNASSLPLLGLVLLHLSADLAPDCEHAVRRTSFFARLAVPIAFGFLLLIPLQGYLLWQQSSSETALRNGQLERQERRITSVRHAIEGSSTIAELQQRLKALQVPTLSADEQSLSLPQLKAVLNASLEQVDRAVQGQRRLLPSTDPLSLLILILRNAAACLALAIGYAALGQRRHAPMALLMEWHDCLDRIFQRRVWRRRRQSYESEQQLASYVEDLSREAEQGP